GAGGLLRGRLLPPPPGARRVLGCRAGGAAAAPVAAPPDPPRGPGLRLAKCAHQNASCMAGGSPVPLHTRTPQSLARRRRRKAMIRLSEQARPVDRRRENRPGRLTALLGAAVLVAAVP